MGVQDQLRQRLLHDGIKGNAAGLGQPAAPLARPGAELPGPFLGGPPPGPRPGGMEMYGPGGVPMRVGSQKPQLPGPFIPPNPVGPGGRPGGGEAFGPGGVPLRPPVPAPLPPAQPVDPWHDGIKGNAAAGLAAPLPTEPILPTEAPLIEPPAWPPQDVNQIRRTGGQMGLQRLLRLSAQQGPG